MFFFSEFELRRGGGRRFSDHIVCQVCCSSGRGFSERIFNHPHCLQCTLFAGNHSSGKKILVIIVFLISLCEQLLFTGCNLLWRKLLASRLPSSQFKLLRFVFPAYPRQPFLELFNGGNDGKGFLSKHLNKASHERMLKFTLFHRDQAIASISLQLQQQQQLQRQKQRIGPSFPVGSSSMTEVEVEIQNSPKYHYRLQHTLIIDQRKFLFVLFVKIYSS